MHIILNVLLVTFFSIVFCEFALYYLILLKCKWPTLKNQDDSVRVMILADPHMLGPVRGHWLDKFRREWQMHRTFQTSMTLFKPELVFILGDVFDEGYFVNYNAFVQYVSRFHRLFYTPSETEMIAVVGNHDIGFHYRAHPHFVYRFENAFPKTSGINLISRKDVQFVTINSVAMEDDGCDLCEAALNELQQLSGQLKCSQGIGKCTTQSDLKYSRPIILQHFPTFRKSDKHCLDHDNQDIETFRENWDVLSLNATNLLNELLNPRVAFSGHSHRYCRVVNAIGIEEYTLTSFSWRNTKTPSFILANFSPQQYNVEKCLMPTENVILTCYAISLLLILGLIIRNYFLKLNQKKIKNL